MASSGVKVYLAGPINGCTDSEAKDWRAVAAQSLIAAGERVCDPMSRDYRGRELAFGQARQIVEGDKNDIDGCDALLANCPKPSVGTSMEVLYAYERGKVVVVVAPFPMSPWLIYHAHATCDSLDAALEHLRGLREAVA